jgi:hypothetical protein
MTIVRRSDAAVLQLSVSCNWATKNQAAVLAAWFEVARAQAVTFQARSSPLWSRYTAILCTCGSAAFPVLHLPYTSLSRRRVFMPIRETLESSMRMT